MRFSWMGLPAVPFLVAVALRAPLATIGVDDVQWPTGLVDDRIAGDYRTVTVPDKPWTLITGGSTAFYGFDGSQLGPVRKQTFERGFPSDVALALSWDLHRTLPPERWPKRVVWGLTMASLVDRKGEAVHPCTTSVARSRPDPRIVDPYSGTGLCGDLAERGSLGDRMGLLYARLDPWSARRDATRDLVVNRVRAWWGVGLPEPEPDDWSGHPGHDEAALRRNLVAWENFGVFGPNAVYPPHAASVREVARLCRQAGIPLTLVGMPEPSVVRARYEPASRAAFDALLRASSDDVLDLWSAVPDTMFYDQVHVDADGRARVTAALAEHL